jgi:hypothetical protein
LLGWSPSPVILVLFFIPRGDIDLVRGTDRLTKILDPATEALEDLRDSTSAEHHQDDHENDQQLGDSQTEHGEPKTGLRFAHHWLATIEERRWNGQ